MCHIHTKNKLIFISIFVGIFSGLAAVILKQSAHYIATHILPDWGDMESVLFIFFPTIGMLLTVLYFKYIQQAKVGSSLADIIYNIEHKSSKIKVEKTHSHVIGGALTVGFGGSTGLEAPIAVTGAAIGSNIARFFKLNFKERSILLAAGASAGIAAIFNSPIAGVLFSIELLLPEFSIPTVIPLLVATACASVISKLLYEGQLFFLISSGWNIESIPFYILLAIGIGGLAAWFTRTVIQVKDTFAKYDSTFRKVFTGSFILGFLIFVLPPLYGEGYHTIEVILSGNYENIFGQHWVFSEWLSDHYSLYLLIIIAIVIIVLKPFATAVTIAAGGVGGVFAPSLFVGALGGFVFSQLINQLNIVQIPTENFVVAGMAGMLSGVLHAPLMAIFLIAEITGGYSLFVPLMTVSALAFFASRFFEKETIYTYHLAQKGLLIGTNKDKFVLQHLKLISLINLDFSVIKPSITLGELADVVAHSIRNVFPVIDENDKLLGIIILDDIRELMFQQEYYDKLQAKDIMKDPPVIIDRTDSVEAVMIKFDKFAAWHLPVVYEGRYMGMISKKDIFSAYRDYLKEFGQEV